ncbi:mechanosensitive ion channel family protein [Winogradskyella sp. A3E31]|uniref:mechanosensitive ion channel family protein n=1 Tax=Winogradskyella sp. A3E31 TaxID=3349637 RepID=UPI00398AAED8
MKEQFEIAITNLIEKLKGWFNTIIEYIPNFILVVLVMIVSYYIARKINKLVTKAMDKKVDQPSISKTIGRISAVVIVLGALFLSLGILNLSKALTSLLAGAGVAGLAVGLALQGTISNTFAGVVLSFRKRIQIGHWVETNGFSGEIIDINLKEFILKETDNNMVVIPNKTILENPLKNYSLTNRMRMSLECGVGYESDLEKVEQLTKETIAKAIDNVESADEVEFYFTEFGGSSINYLCRFWIESTSFIERLRTKNKAIIAVKKAYDKEGINIPFPIRTLQFDNNLSIDQPIQFKETVSKN